MTVNKQIIWAISMEEPNWLTFNDYEHKRLVQSGGLPILMG